MAAVSWPELPGSTVIVEGLRLKLLMPGALAIVRVNVSSTEVTPEPLARTRMVCPLTSCALLLTVSVIAPDVPVPGCE